VHRGFLPVGKTHKQNIWSDENYGEFSLLLLSEGGEVHKLGWILAHRVCGFLNMQPPIKVKLN
jgi:hypothetical protein